MNHIIVHIKNHATHALDNYHNFNMVKIQTDVKVINQHLHFSFGEIVSGGWNVFNWN